MSAICSLTVTNYVLDKISRSCKQLIETMNSLYIVHWVKNSNIMANKFNLKESNSVISILSYWRFGNVRENLFFAKICEFVVSRIQSSS